MWIRGKSIESLIVSGSEFKNKASVRYNVTGLDLAGFFVVCPVSKSGTGENWPDRMRNLENY